MAQPEINAATDPQRLALLHTDERVEIPNRASIRPIDAPFIDFASPCQIWMRATVKGGYPLALVRGRMTIVTRFAWALSRRVSLSDIDGLVVRHIVCDTPGCINPFHLAIGTQKDNVGDCKRQGRTRKAGGRCPGNAGERSAHAKLTTADVVEIRSLFAEGCRQRVLAQRFGVSETQISRVARRVSWAHVE
ncbi:helix-turn-helix domain-containing protein [Burkholderia pyrrocinia]|uniref:helix-turn-helix domain-containing protein n=1 Tax=Burkholderia pyrrocinia TaxID=60550 RepID=UPI001BCA76CC|nr:helix-turn-helix domain-containing protein [Burkholderia pyrrocinia]QVN18852.1 helix-turn-helix domain-containing protein [Burkholderia pyrrocinia]